MKKVIVKTTQRKSCYSPKLYEKYYNKPISKADFIQMVFDEFLSEKERLYWETQEEFTFEKVVRYFFDRFDYYFKIE